MSRKRHGLVNVKVRLENLTMWLSRLHYFLALKLLASHLTPLCLSFLISEMWIIPCNLYLEAEWHTDGKAINPTMTIIVIASSTTLQSQVLKSQKQTTVCSLWTDFHCKEPDRKYFRFWGQKDSVSAILFCHCGVKAALCNVESGRCCVLIQLYSWTLTFRSHCFQTSQNMILKNFPPFKNVEMILNW